MKKKTLLLQALAICLLSAQSCFLPEEEGDGIITTSAYSVAGAEITLDEQCVSPVSSIETEIHKKAWERILRVIPDGYEDYIVRFEIFSDGEAETLAYVEPVYDSGAASGSEWTLAVDMMDSWGRTGEIFEDVLTETLVHEFAHILSLNDSQIDAATDGQDSEEWRGNWDFSKAYRTDEGIAKNNSYIARFFSEFWGADLLAERLDLEASGTSKTGYPEYNAFAAKHYTDFVSDYAMTNPEEDFAESFMFFTLSDLPKKTTVASEKILFFYSFPELTDLRTEIRTALGL